MTTNGATLPHIGVLDSGVGGLSIFATLRQRWPRAVYSYCSDNANFPYGLKSEAEVIRCTQEATRRFIARCQLDLLVIACNTMSTVALPHLRAEYRIPLVGVVPAIKPAAQRSKTGTIGLLATPGTVQRAYTNELIATHAAHCLVIKTGSNTLVELAERKLRGGAVAPSLVARELAPLFAASPTAAASRMDIVVLGCTHFPLLSSELSAVSPWPVQWIDSSAAIAARMAELLRAAGFDPEAGPENFPPPMNYMTAGGEALAALVPALSQLGFAKTEIL